VNGASQIRDGVRDLRRGDTMEGSRNLGSGVLETASGALTVGGSRAAVPFTVASTVVQLDRAADDHARRTGALGARDGYTSTRGVGRPHGQVNRDFGDSAEDAGRWVERRTGSRALGAVGAGGARVAMLPATALYGAGALAVDNAGRTDVTDLEARDQEARGAPLGEASPAVRAERLRQRAAAVTPAAQAVEAPVRTDVGAPGRASSAVTEARIRRRALEIQQQWARERGQVSAGIDFGEQDRAERQARAELESESGRAR
jgi:hypothetical protein